LHHPVWNNIVERTSDHEYVLRAACRFITYSVLILGFDAARGDMGGGG